MKFNADRAFDDLTYQVSLGPRIPGSEPYFQTIDWIIDTLEGEGWEVEKQSFQISGKIFNNLIAKRQNQGEWIILGAHFDTRQFADHDPDPSKRELPVPGANDGASGVAILLELARILPKDFSKNIWLVFFDAEDNGGINGLDWALGSQYFVENIEGKPNAVIIVDMLGDEDLEIYYEISSDQILSTEIWNIAEELGHLEFIPQAKYHMIDDHTAFLMEGIPAIVMIDFDFPYWHTTEDTLDKVSPYSLQVVGETLFTWLIRD